MKCKNCRHEIGKCITGGEWVHIPEGTLYELVLFGSAYLKKRAKCGCTNPVPEVEK